MTIFTWPARLEIAAVAFDPRGMVAGGPRTLTGRSQVVSVDAGYWIARVRLVTLGQGAQINTLRQLRARLEGGAHEVLVPVADRGQAPWITAGVYTTASSDFTDDTDFTDGTGFHEPTIRIKLKTAAALRASQITATVTAAGTITGGMPFSVADHLYVIREVVSTSGSDQTWSIWPPLRGPIGADRRLEFDAPVCRMRLASEDALDISLGRLWQTAPEISFVEVI